MKVPVVLYPQQHLVLSDTFSFFFLKINLCIYLFLAVLGLRCCAQAFSSCGEQGLRFVAVRGLLVAEHEL